METRSKRRSLSTNENSPISNSTTSSSESFHTARVSVNSTEKTIQEESTHSEILEEFEAKCFQDVDKLLWKFLQEDEQIKMIINNYVDEIKAALNIYLNEYTHTDSKRSGSSIEETPCVGREPAPKRLKLKDDGTFQTIDVERANFAAGVVTMEESYELDEKTRKRK